MEKSGPASRLMKLSGVPADESGVRQYRDASLVDYGMKPLDFMHQVHLRISLTWLLSGWHPRRAQWHRRVAELRWFSRVLVHLLNNGMSFAPSTNSLSGASFKAT